MNRANFLVVLLLIVLIAGSAHGAIYRSRDSDDISRRRDAVTYIDMGRVKNNAYQLHYFSLVCVDGVKVLTTENNSNMQTIIIPGPCDGPQKTVHNQKRKKPSTPVVINTSGDVTW